MKTYRETCAMFEQMEISEQLYERQTPSKKRLGQMLTMTVMVGKEREENPPRIPIQRRATLAIARQKCSLSKQEGGRCTKGILVVWTQTLL